jgi:single-stranded-DNA-specific exonuclease
LPYPEKNLCGAAVAFKLAQALLATLGWPEVKLRRVLESFLKMVAIATVADVVPLTGENRVIVKHGLDGLGEVRNPGLRALLDVAGFTAAWCPAPARWPFRSRRALNAAGRMDTAKTVIDLFLSTTRRAPRTGPTTARSERRTPPGGSPDPRNLRANAGGSESTAALVYYGEDWHRGVLGIVASRLVERFHRPVFVLGRNAEDGWRKAPAAAFRRFIC